jgi:hypothetical protein
MAEMPAIPPCVRLDRHRPLEAADLAACEHDVLVDQVFPGEPLFVSFAFVDWDGQPGFYFHGRSRKLDQRRGRPFNRVLLRDPSNRWYLRGIRGLGDDAPGSAAALARIVAAIGPSQVITVGESMGAWGALLYGALIGADRAIAHGALSFFDPVRARSWGDLRWLTVMEALARDPPRTVLDDLPAVLRACPRPMRVDLFVGERGDPGDPGVNFDLAHAQRLRTVPGVHVHRVPEAGHPVPAHLVAAGCLDDGLAHLLLDAPPTPALAATVRFDSPLPESDLAQGATAIDAHWAPVRAPLFVCVDEREGGRAAAWGRALDRVEAIWGRPVHRLVVRFGGRGAAVPDDPVRAVEREVARQLDAGRVASLTIVAADDAAAACALGAALPAQGTLVLGGAGAWVATPPPPASKAPGAAADRRATRAARALDWWVGTSREHRTGREGCPTGLVNALAAQASRAVALHLREDLRDDVAGELDRRGELGTLLFEHGLLASLRAA